jgi:NAD(P)-dependent dehydrogenase (short-subunit alcohol dehydrogenase family)
MATYERQWDDVILWLVSDEARYITGTVVPVDAGNVNRR